MRFSPKRKNNFFKKVFSSISSGKKPDYILIGLIFLIIIFGLSVLSSASSVRAFNKFNDIYYFFKHQLVYGFLPGVFLFLFFFHFDYNKLQKHSVSFLVLSLTFLGLVFIPGIGMTLNQARSWLSLGPVSFQPTEIVKLLLILFFAGWFAERESDMTKDFWNGVIPFTIILGLISLPIILQPDIGTLIVIILVSFTMYFVAGGQLKHLAGLGLVGLGGVGLLIAQAPYRAARLMTFLHPEFDPQGIGYHINQAFLAIGSGGWFGLGFGQSRQKFAYLPEVMGDSIFAIIAEELGFLVAIILIGLFIFIFLRGLKVAQSSRDEYGKYVVVGIISWFTIQTFLNIGAMVGLLPLTGIPLPFISYGGSSLMSIMAATGILANISKTAKIS